jgi:hypothetical protein
VLLLLLLALKHLSASDGGGALESEGQLNLR